VRKLIELGYERALRAASLGAAVRLGQDQLPRIWVLHRQVFNTLDMERVPGLYITQFPLANAYAIGTEKPIVVLNSELVRLLDDDGRRVVLAHEAAHIHSDHQLYRTALLILLRIGSAARLPLLAGLPLLAIQMALLEWSRAAELSCDRAAALVTRDPQAVCRALMVMTAGEAAEELNLDAFIAQGMEYSTSGSGLERLTRLLQDLQVTHPLPVRRVRLLLDWVREGEYDRMIRGDYLRRGEEASAREEAEEASTFYGERIAGTFQAAGSSVADVGQQLGDWLKRVRSTDAENDEQ
jgi:Zn-dependent protease with chaperone function